MKWNVGLVIVGLSIVFAIGCEKKKPVAAPDPVPAPPAYGEVAQDAEEAAKPVIEEVKVAAEEAKEAANAAVAEVKQAFTSEIDVNKTVDALKAEAGTMDVASLTQVAVKYKDAIVSKQGEIKAIADKLAAIPMTEKLGTEAQQLTAESTKLAEALKALTDRFNVYVSALKAKGGDVSGLTL